ncbi:hypothetical protein BDU57DRAFT_533392 [Ampelomyces quisqualis]|uniref:Uncharacterized protein n=1 Tax=Ampelomyces quisqualis TaxID=50730 RepID=A0A6A5QA61_AMPQU|nr:hypothetical protein BDU57DRAFT_533392 [Ampelomyces quisqualis]
MAFAVIFISVKYQLDKQSSIFTMIIACSIEVFFSLLVAIKYSILLSESEPPATLNKFCEIALCALLMLIPSMVLKLILLLSFGIYCTWEHNAYERDGVAAAKPRRRRANRKKLYIELNERDRTGEVKRVNEKCGTDENEV